MGVSGSCDRRCPLLLSLAIAALIALLAPGVAHALNLRVPLSGVVRQHEPGVPAAVPTPQALAGALEQSTGLTPSQVTAANVCAPVPIGMARCAAKSLRLRSDGGLVRPHVHARKTLTRVVASAPGPIPASAPSQSAPSAGTPAWLQQVYDLTYLSQTKGVGDTVAIVDAYDDPTAESDLATYRAQYGLSACSTATGCFRKVNENGQSSPLPSNNSSWEQEISLDLDAVSALCPNCHILLVESSTAFTTDLNQAFATAAALGANQISNSWSGEDSVVPSDAYSGAGVPAVFATGDIGYNSTLYNGYTMNSYPASLPKVIAAGGTSVAAATGGAAGRGFAESGWSTKAGEAATSGCNTYEPKPSFQLDTGCTGRSYADISADADPNTGIAVYDTGSGGWVQLGGTSLSTPLIAAYYAIAGIMNPSPSWAYTNSALLNDPAGGSVGTCAAAIAYICTAGVGYDGPTGIGSISGAVALGAPGIGGPTFTRSGSSANTYVQSTSTTGAILKGGIYPNSIDTTYWIEYGTTSAYGQQTASVDIGSGQAPITVTPTLSSLAGSTTYHFRLVAQNSLGTTYGYDDTLQTLGPGAPNNTVLPQITGTPQQTHTLTVSTGTWNPAGTMYSYQWQRDAGSGAEFITGATTSSYTLQAADVGASITVIVKATNANGTASALSAAVGPIASAQPKNTVAPAITGVTQQGQTLLVSTGTWNPTATSYSYQWQRSTDGGLSWAPISSTATSYVLGTPDLAARVRVTVTASNAYGSVSIATASVGPVTSGAPAMVSAPVITGTAQQGVKLTATSGGWTPSATSLAYQWERSTDNGTTWAAIAGATANTYLMTAADIGAVVRVTVTATNAFGSATASSASTSLVASGAPHATGAPSVIGTAMQGMSLSASTGSWSPTGTTYAFAWQRSTDGGHTWAGIAGASTASYAPVAADVGALLEVTVTATNAYGVASQSSGTVGPIASAAPFSTGAPTVTGSPAQGSTLTVSSTWNPTGTSYAYQWQRSTDNAISWSDIAGATTTSYTVSVADENALVRVTVTATNPYGQASATSAAIGPVTASLPVNVVAPVITVPAPAARRTDKLTATQGTWSGPITAYAYQWQRSADGGVTWTAIAGATSSSYILDVADVGTSVRVLVTATDADGATGQPSNATPLIAPYPPANVVPPVVSGTPQRTYTLSATQGTWTGPGNAYTYQWQEDFGDGFADIAGATDRTYTLTTADEGGTVRVLVTATNPDATITEASQPTSTVLSALPVNSTPPVITGTAQRASTLITNQGVWTGVGNAYAYQWQHSTDGVTWTNIARATMTSYTLTATDEGTYLRMLVTATNADGTGTASSAPTGLVPSSPPLNTAAPVIGGAAVRGSTLTASQGSWGGIGNTYSYQWQRDSGVGFTDIPGATDANYTLAVADEGANVRVRVIATNADGTLSTPSASTSTVRSAPPLNTLLPSITGAALRATQLSASVGAWTGTGNNYAYQWQRSPDGGATWAPISGATTSNYTVGVVDEGSQIRVLVTATNPDQVVTAASNPTATVPSAPPVSIVAPTLSGTAQRAAVLTTTQGGWNGIGNAYTYQWQRSADNGTTWAAIAGATANAYTLAVADEGSRVRAAVTATNADGTATAFSAASASVPSSPPLNTAAPVVSGAAQRASLLSATQGTWSGIGNAYTDQWQRSADNGVTWSDIAGATSSTYLIGVADENAKIRVVVTATNADGTLGVPSAATATVPSAPPVNTTAPTLAGAAQRASALSAAQGTWTGIGNTYAYQWQHDSGSGFVAISGATGSTYTLTVADENTQVRVLVTATNPDGTVSAPSAATATIPSAPPVDTAPPTISGTAQRTFTLTANQGTWTGIGNSYAYQWQRSADGGVTWAPIAGATASSYTLVSADEGAVVRVLVTATNVDGVQGAASAASAAVQGGPPVNTTAPTISGTAQRASTLTATAGSWSGFSNAYTYQWQRSADNGVTWSNIAGATASTYTVAVADESEQVRVLVTATNPDGSAGAPSAASATVPSAPPVNTAVPSITGTPQRAALLFVGQGTWSGIGNAYAYRWQRSADGITWSDVSGATAATYIPGVADENLLLRAVVTATNPDGTVSAPTAATAAVLSAPPVVAALPTLTGTAQRTATLTTTNGTWSGAGNTYSYSWQRSADGGTTWTDIAGAGGSAYTLTAADEATLVRSFVTVTNLDGSAGIGSAPTSAVLPAPPVNTGKPTITGLSRIGAVLSAGTGNWTPGGVAFAYQWQRADSSGAYQDIVGATASTYTLGAADVGDTVRALVTATNVDGPATAASVPTSTILQPPRSTSPPAAPTGTLQDSYRLTPDPGSWDTPGATFNYSWLRCPAAATVVDSSCTAVGSGATYTVVAADVGHPLAVSVTAGSVGGISAPVTSPLTAVVQGRPLTTTVAPSINGTPQIPNQLSANPGTWSVPTTSVAYSWHRCDADGTSNCTQVAGNTAQYTLSAADQNHTIVLQVDVTSPGRSASATSPPLTIQNQPLPQPRTLPTVAGTAARTNRLQGSEGTWTGNPTLGYQWQRCDTSGGACQNIAGANNLSYVLVQADEGHTIVLTVTATNASGSTRASSPATGAVAASLPVSTVAPQIRGGAAAQQSVQLGITGTDWQTPDATSYASSWQRCDTAGAACQPIAGATGSVYTPGSADVGHTLVAAVTATNVDGSVRATSKPTSVVLPAPPRWKALPQLTNGVAQVGDTVTVTPGTWSGPVVSTLVTQLVRCFSTCTPVGAPGAGSYVIAPGDLGAILRVRETATNSGGTTVVWSSQYVGPIGSISSGSAVLSAAAAVPLRNSVGDTLALASFDAAVVQTAAARAHGAAVRARTVAVRRARGVRGSLKAWACPVSSTPGGPPQACSRAVVLGARGRLQLPPGSDGKVRVVVVRRGH